MPRRVSHGAALTWSYDRLAAMWRCSRGEIYKESDGWWIIPAKHREHSRYGPYWSKTEAMEAAEEILLREEHDEEIYS